jgi:transposase
MNKCKTFVGIDVSKKTFDAAILGPDNPQQIHHHVFVQTPEGYASFITWLQEYASVSDVIICMEHTGIYINGLVDFLMLKELAVWVEMPLRIKKMHGFAAWWQ